MHANDDWVTLGNALSLVELAAIADGRCRLRLDRAARERMRASADCLGRLLAQGQTVYGINTGYGPLADTALTPALAEQLQRGLIRHLCSGVGPWFTRREVRAMLAARVANLVQGWSGVGPEVAEALLALLDHELIPVVPQQGTVGASGDLTPLAHIALALIGEGAFLGTTHGTTRPAREALAQAGLAPLSLAGRAGLALVNGTSAMTALAALNAVAADNAIAWLTRLTLCHGEVQQAHAAAWHPRLASARPHPGQRQASEQLFQLAANSRRLRRQPATRGVQHTAAELWSQPAPQDAYSLRCAPQEIGAARDVLAFHDAIIVRELNAACDNPLIDVELETVWHGGNFYGQQVAYAADALNMAVVKLAVFAERGLARITDARLNEGLPPFLSGGRAGLDSGLMGAQVTASALVAELRTRAMPASIQSIPTNANNQDVVTMGTLAARRCGESLAMFWQILAILALALAQAMDLRLREGARLTDFSASSRNLHAVVRERSAFLVSDRPLGEEIVALADRLRDQPGAL